MAAELTEPDFWSILDELLDDAAHDTWDDQPYTKMRFWCLSHNFDVVGTILMMADVSWRKGWDSGLAVRSLADAKPLLTY